MRSLTLLVLISAMTFGMAGEVRAENPTAPMRIRGYCVDEQGKGIAGAEVFLAEYALEHRTLAQTTSGRDGFFELVDIAMPYRKAEEDGGSDRGMFQVFGLADGFGFAWLPISRFDPNPPKDKVVPFPRIDVTPLPQYYGGSAIELKLIFSRARTLSGRVVDSEGKPIAGASLEIRYCDREVTQADYSQTHGPSAFDVINEPEIVPPDVKTQKTDADGRFQFSSLPPDCRFWTWVKTSERLTRTLWLSTGKVGKADVKGVPIHSDGAEVRFPRTFRAPLQVSLADTQQPAERILVMASNKEGSASGVTDSKGGLHLSLPAGAYSVQLIPRTGSPYLPTRTSLTVSQNAASDQSRFALNSAAVVEVSVCDAITAKGLEGVDFWVERDGKPSVHFSWSYEQEGNIQHVERPTTNADGGLTALFPPGRHRVGIALQAWPKGYRGVEPAHQDIECRAGETSRIKFQMKRDEAIP